MTLQFFETNNMTFALFKTWQNLLESFTHAQQKQRVLYAWSSILKLPPKGIPDMLMQSISPLLSKMITISKDLIKLRNDDTEFEEAIDDASPYKENRMNFANNQNIMPNQ